jgi:hypothetical protein
MSEKNLSELLAKSISAQDRTTHAVRALVRFLFIQLSFLTAAFVVWQIGLAFPDEDNCTVLGCEPHGSVLFFVALIVITGVVISSAVGWYELARSNVPLSEIEQEARKKLEMEALLEQERINKRNEERRRELEKARAKKWQELVAFVKKPKVRITSAIVGVAIVVGFVSIYSSATSWSNLVKPCDSLMKKNPSSLDDSYSFDSTNNEITIVVGFSPRGSDFVNCIGESLAVDAPDLSLGMYVMNNLLVGLEDSDYGNLKINTSKLDESAYQLVIRPNN